MIMWVKSELMWGSFRFIDGLKNNLKGKGDEEWKVDYNDFIFQLAKKIMP